MGNDIPTITPYEAMSDDELNHAVCEALGWRVTCERQDSDDGLSWWRVAICNPQGKLQAELWDASRFSRDEAIADAWRAMPYPDYARDLNAAWELRALMSDWATSIGAQAPYSPQDAARSICCAFLLWRDKGEYARAVEKRMKEGE